jgi:LPXTG-site transpeptidase (sortase) family protein
VWSTVWLAYAWRAGSLSGEPAEAAPTGAATSQLATPEAVTATVTPLADSTPAPPGTAAAVTAAPTDGEPGAENGEATLDAWSTAEPPRLIISRLGLDEVIVEVPVVEGQWDLEHLGKAVGRLATTGQYPGDDFAMTLAGHTTVAVGVSGPFRKLRELEFGDEVIYRSLGRDFVYTVQTRVAIQPDEVERLYVSDGERLLLLTCTDWNFLSREYDRRILVDAKLVETRPAP